MRQRVDDPTAVQESDAEIIEIGTALGMEQPLPPVGPEESVEAQAASGVADGGPSAIPSLSLAT